MRRLLPLLALLLAGCGSAPTVTPPQPAKTATPSTTPSSRPALGTVPPSWLGKRPLALDADGFGRVQQTPPALRDRRFTLPDSVPALPGTGFASRVGQAPADVLARSTWQQACPVAAADLDWIRLTFWSFDDARHTGELLVNRSAAHTIVTVFRKLYAARFPLEQMRITPPSLVNIPPTGDGNNTEAFSCRPSRGTTQWSQHAYGLAVDVNPFQNPYVKGARVLPELASSYTDRARARPGMIEPGGVVTRAFQEAGWGWGGSWSGLKDYEHFSANGR